MTMNYTKKVWIKIFLLCLSVMYSFISIFYGMNLTDTFYYLAIFKSEELNPLILGFQLIGKSWVYLFGDSIFGLRIINWIFFACSFILSYFLFVEKRFLTKYLLLLAVPFFLQPAMSLNIFNGDSCTLLVLVWYLKSFLNWKDKTNVLNSVCLMVSSSLLVLLRFPNIVVFPISFFILILWERKYINWFKFVFISALSLFSYIIINTIAFDNFALFIHSFIHILNNSDTNHSMGSLIGNYIRDGYVFMTYLPFCLVVVYLLTIHNYKRYMNYFVLSLIAFYLWIFLEKIVKISLAAWNFSMFISSFISAIMILLCINALNKKKYHIVYFAISSFTLSFVLVSGSDTGLLRLQWLLLSLFPFIYAQYMSQFHLRLGSLIVLSLVIVFAIIHRYKMPFNEESTEKLTLTIHQYPQLRYIYTGDDYYNLIRDVSDDYKHFNTDNVVFWGTRSTAFYELLNIENRMPSSFFMSPDNIDDIENLRKVIEERQPFIYFMPYYTHNNKDIYKNITQITDVEKVILQYGYKKKVNGRYFLYIPAN